MLPPPVLRMFKHIHCVFFCLSQRQAPHPQGALYASPATDDAPSTILYRPFAPWASNSDWMMQLPRPEQARCVAAGGHFCAAATDGGWLRLWSEGGVQLHVSSLPGPVVAMAANEELLAVVTVASVQSAHTMGLHYMVCW